MNYPGKNAHASRPFAVVAGFVLPHCRFFAPKELSDTIVSAFTYYVAKPTVAELVMLGLFKCNCDIERLLPTE